VNIPVETITQNWARPSSVHSTTMPDSGGTGKGDRGHVGMRGQQVAQAGDLARMAALDRAGGRLGPDPETAEF